MSNPHWMSALIACAGALLALEGCAYRHEKGVVDDSAAGRNAGAQVSFEKVKEKVFGPYCISCHGSAGGVSLETFDNVRSVLDRIEDEALTRGTMPPNGPLDEASAKLLSDWIKSGAPERVGAALSADELTATRAWIDSR